MDGTLVDNMRFHTRAWVALAERLGLEVEPSVFEHELAGRKTDEILIWLVGRELTRAELDELAHEKESAYRELYRPELEPMPGLLDLLGRLERRGVPRAVATAAPPGNRELVLEGLGIAPRFERVIGSEHAPRGKPAPDIYLAAARELGVPPANCVAFEDAVNGVLSARAAGMTAVGVLTTTTEAALLEAGARWVIADFRELPPELEALLQL
jgi:HAD superfamily hydrolase (TIGR01509 family)